MGKNETDETYDLLFTGLSTREFIESELTKKYIRKLNLQLLNKVHIFYIRIVKDTMSNKMVQYMINTCGYVLDKMNKYLIKKNIGQVISKNYFDETGGEGPFEEA